MIWRNVAQELILTKCHETLFRHNRHLPSGRRETVLPFRSPRDSGSRPAILNHLKVNTQRHHDELEALLHLDQGALGRSRYVEILRRFERFYRPLEQKLLALKGWERYGLQLAARSRTGRLRQDIEHLRAHPLPAESDLPRLESLAQGFGSLYVLEGASLGGQVISRRLSESDLQLSAQHGAAFFNGSGSQTGEQWREFWAALEEFHLEHGCADEMAQSAADTFAALTRTCADLPD